MLPVNVTPIVPAYIEISGLPEQTQYYGTPVSLGGLQVTAVTDGGQRFILDPDAYTVKLAAERSPTGISPKAIFMSWKYRLRTNPKDLISSS